MKPKGFLIPTVIAFVLAAPVGLWQYSLHQKLSETDMSCGGDWSYAVKCPLGSYCRSLGQGPLAGGLCKPWLSPVFEVFEVHEEPTQTTTSVEEPSSEEWGTYTNEALGFSVRYPKIWSPPKERFLSTRTDVEWDGLTISVGVFYDQGKGRELSYLEVAERLAFSKELIKTTIDGQPAVYLKMRDEDLPHPKPNPYNLVVIQKERSIYQLHASLPIEKNFPREYQEAQARFDQTLSTFKFLE